MRRILISLVVMPFATALLVWGASAQAPRDTASTGDSARETGEFSGSTADWRPASRLIPVWRLSPTGVRIRSVQDKRNVIIILPRPAVVVAPGRAEPPLTPGVAPSAPAAAAPPAAEPRAQYVEPVLVGGRAALLADSAFRASVLTRTDMERMEARLQAYLDRRFFEFQQAERALAAQRETLAVRAYEPEKVLLAPQPGGANVVLVPVPLTPGAPLDTAKLVADITARLAEAQSRMLARAESLALVSRAAPPDTSRVPPSPLGPDTLGLRPGEIAVPPEPEIIEVERAIMETGVLRAVTVLFETNRANLLPASLSMLSALGRVLEKHPAVHIEIGGHTDSSGPAEYNLELSQARAESVRDYLLENFQIDSHRLVARGFGESKPIASDDTATGRALNRRVEFVVTETEED